MSLHISSHSKLPRPRESSFSGPDLKLFVKDVADKHGRKRAITVKTWSTVKDVKDVVNTLLHVPPSNQRLYFGPLMTSGYDLPNHRSLNDVGIYRSGETLFLEMKGNAYTSLNSRLENMTTLTSSGSNDICVALSVLNVTPKHLRKVVQQARRGLALGLKPDLVLEGSGGTYFMHDPKKVRVAVFKPADEEPYADNNPRGYIRQAGGTGAGGKLQDTDDCSMSLREGIKPGEACLREVAAYLLDHGSFSDVPMTTLAEARHPAFNHNGSMLKLSQGGAAVGNHRLSLSTSQSKPMLDKKVGSFQCFVNAECSMDDLSPSKLSIEEVHKIAVLDIRTMNADRNTANLLCRRNREDPDTFELIPIDHGYCLRTVADICWFDWCWLDWPQMKEPLSAKTKNYILNIDIDADVRMLKEILQIPQGALDIFIASNKLLKEGVKAGLSLYDIAVMCCRNDDAGELPSKLESFMTMAEDVAVTAVDNGRWHHAAASRALAQKISSETNTSRLARSEKISPMSMFKSASSANFSSFSSGPSNTPPTPMAQSSGSDSSSDAGDGGGDEEECEQWAAAIIADKLETSDTPRLSVSPSWRGRQRAISVSSSSDDSTDDSEDSSNDSSSSSLSSSPAGFWCVPPTSPKRELDHDISWSPHISPATTPKLLEGIGPSREHDKSDSKGRESVVKFNSSTFLIPPAALLHKVKPIEEALRDEDDKDKPTRSKNNFLSIPAPNLTIKRSQSYSAFTSDLAESLALEQTKARSKTPNTSTEQFRTYYHKFIDLLITRHVRAHVRQTSQDSDGAKDAGLVYGQLFRN